MWTELEITTFTITVIAIVDAKREDGNNQYSNWIELSQIRNETQNNKKFGENLYWVIEQINKRKL